MATSKYTVEDALDIITHGDFYVVGYKNQAYIFSQEHWGDEDFDYGIYYTVPLSNVESGKLCLFDSVPDYFIDDPTLIDHIIACFPICSVFDAITYQNVRKELENKSISDWYKVLKPYAYRDVEDYIEISKLYAGQLDFKSMSVEQAGQREIELIEKYNEQ